MMGSPTAEQNASLRAGLMVALMLLALLPVGPAGATHGSEGDPANLQAQHINATFSNDTQATTVTWENLVSTDIGVLSSLFSATYNVYRHNSLVTTANLATLTPFAQIDACDSGSAGGNPGYCSGNTHPGHSVQFPVPPGTNDSFYYAITTTLSNGTEAAELIFNASIVFDPVLEVTKPVQTPFIISAQFDAESSQTTLNWLNFNSIHPVLPETGPDALEIRVWRTEFQITRSNGIFLPATTSPIATLNSTDTQYVVDIPPNTQRESYYSITYLLPNYSGSGMDYEDLRFVGQNTLSTPVVEDNRPPDQPTCQLTNRHP